MGKTGKKPKNTAKNGSKGTKKLNDKSKVMKKKQASKKHQMIKEKRPTNKWKPKKNSKNLEGVPEQKPMPKLIKEFTDKKSDNKTDKTESLRSRMLKRLEAARFRQINEELDQGVGQSPQLAFNSSIELFQKYHTAYKERIQHWPSDPLDIIIKSIKKKLPQDKIIADFGCGEARLASSVTHKVHSFDLFALNDRVTACDMTSTPLKDGSVDLAVFCLSLMGTDVGKFIAEAARVLKQKGVLKIAEVASRFPENNASGFVKKMKKFGFVSKDKVKQGNFEKGNDKQSVPRGDVFLLLEFMKIRPMSQVKGKMPPLKLLPCTYKKR